MAISTDDYARMAADSYKNWPDGHAVDGADFEVELNGTEAIKVVGADAEPIYLRS
jgi:hypothetical protein